MGFLLQHPCRLSLDHLVEMAQSSQHDDTPAMNEIIRRFDGLALYIARSIRVPVHLQDDLSQAARIGLVSAVRHHDGRPGFPGFAQRYMRGAALRELSRRAVPETADSDGLDDHADRSRPDEIVQAEDELAPWGGGPVSLAVAQLDHAQRNIIDLRYRQDLAVKEIAAAVGTSGPAVSQRLATIHRHVAMAMAA
jgi:RNA polymerase sigma factor (sigma-70 family)